MPTIISRVLTKALYLQCSVHADALMLSWFYSAIVANDIFDNVHEL